MNCLNCIFGNKKKVVQPKGFVMCENKKSEHHKSVVKEGCKKGGNYILDTP